MGKLQVDLLGASFAVQAREDDEYLAQLLSYYKDITTTIKRSGNLKDPLQISILAGISLVDELYKQKKLSMSYKKVIDSGEYDEAERITGELISKLNKALAGDHNNDNLD